MKEIRVNGFEEFISTIEGRKDDEKVIVFFTGSVGEDGNSWCPDCVAADPVIKETVEPRLKDGDDVTIFIHCSVGPREYWKDLENPFRRNRDVALKCVPTLMSWKRPQRLEETQCANKDLVDMLFEED